MTSKMKKTMREETELIMVTLREENQQIQKDKSYDHVLQILWFEENAYNSENTINNNIKEWDTVPDR